MGEILKIVLNQKSIYNRAKLYKALVNQKFDINNKIPLLYRARDKDKVINLFTKYNIENESLQGDFGILYLFIFDLDIIHEIIKEVKDYVYFDFSYPIKFSDTNSNFNSCVFEVSNSKNLYGEGVVIAFIDSGIDYTLDAFRNEDGSTRIRYMYDPSTNLTYDRKQINEALRSDNPYEKINQVDFKGHGTQVASVACAGGEINRSLYGVAPKSEIISVNATNNINSVETLFHTIMKGLDFLSVKQDEEKFPLVVNLSFSTNYGAHTGTSLFEEYIRNFATRELTTVVVSAGNEGGASHHKSGIITQEGEDIGIEVSGEHKAIPISFYKGVLSDVLVKVISPTTGSSQYVKLLEGSQIIRLGGDVVTILYSGPNIYNVQGECQIIVGADRKEFIEQGVWTINIKLDNEYESPYNMWLPITESIGNKTKFLMPDNNNTLGSPATVYNVISVGSYNYRTETVSIFSGRGDIDDANNLKPDILAPGEEIRVISPENRVSTVSGTSFAAPVVSGICALLMEWGIVQNNKVNLYGEVIKYFLVRGAKRIRDIKYPNNSYGYGFVCASKALMDIENNINNMLVDIARNIDITREDIQNNNLTQTNDEDINLLNYDEMKIKLCPLNVFNDDNRIEFIALISKNAEINDEDVCVYPLEDQTNENYVSIMSIPINKINYLDRNYFANEYITVQKLNYYTLSDESISPISDAGIYQTQNNEYLNLTGRGVIIGIIDTGIDYLNSEFINELGETKILEIWDQTIEVDVHQPNVLFGKRYTKEDINNAISLKKNGGDPYTIVPSVDTNGHGTAMAGITSSIGYGAVKGCAPDSELVVVKLKEISDNLKEELDFPLDGTPIYNDVAVYTALRYLKRVRFKYDKPVVVVLPLQSNGGDHCGNSVVTKQISDYSENTGFVVCSSSGNQANKQIHTEGTIMKENQSSVIELFVDKGQDKLHVSIYIQNFAKASIFIVSPSGERTQEFNLQSFIPDKYNFKFLFEETQVSLVPTIIDNALEIIQDIEVSFSGLKEGIWQLVIVSKDNNVLIYDAYLQIKEFLRPETRFLNSTSNSTMTSPGTARLGICMAYYNQNFSSLVTNSGEGYTLDKRVSPILAAGGVDILTLGKGNRNILMTGSSVAAAVAAGGIALILEWAIVRKNKVYINSAIIIWLLVSSAVTPKGYDYPNKYWGYGILNIRNVFDIMR